MMTGNNTREGENLHTFNREELENENDDDEIESQYDDDKRSK